jgi:hypothetical protein
MNYGATSKNKEVRDIFMSTYGAFFSPVADHAQAIIEVIPGDRSQALADLLRSVILCWQMKYNMKPTILAGTNEADAPTNLLRALESAGRITLIPLHSTRPDGGVDEEALDPIDLNKISLIFLSYDSGSLGIVNDISQIWQRANTMGIPVVGDFTGSFIHRSAHPGCHIGLVDANTALGTSPNIQIIYAAHHFVSAFDFNTFYHSCSSNWEIAHEVFTTLSLPIKRVKFANDASAAPTPLTLPQLIQANIDKLTKKLKSAGVALVSYNTYLHGTFTPAEKLLVIISTYETTKSRSGWFISPTGIAFTFVKCQKIIPIKNIFHVLQQNCQATSPGIKASLVSGDDLKMNAIFCTLSDGLLQIIMNIFEQV